MSRLIDANKIRLPKGFFEKIDNVPKFYEWLDTLPTVDAVEVVRCKDCCHCIHNEFLDTYCCWKFSWSIPTEKDSFCSWAERREDVRIADNN